MMNERERKESERACGWVRVHVRVLNVTVPPSPLEPGRGGREGGVGVVSVPMSGSSDVVSPLVFVVGGELGGDEHLAVVFPTGLAEEAKDFH